jgi:hypothetical protein
MLRAIGSIFSAVKPLDQPIYHYTSADAFRSVIETGEVWATNAAYLNDSGELSYPVRLAQGVLDEFLAAEPDHEVRGFIAGVDSDLALHSFYKSWYVTSFSSRGDLLSQWRAYCPRGGYSIGFDGPRIAASLKRRAGHYFGPVVYKESSQLAKIREIVQEHVQEFRQLISSDADKSEHQHTREMQLYLALGLSEAFIFFKSPAFREEREWRLARHDFAEEETPRFRDRRGLLTPFIATSLAEKDGRLPLHRVFVSPLSDPELALHAAKLCLRVHQYKDPDSLVEMPRYGLRF